MDGEGGLRCCSPELLVGFAAAQQIKLAEAVFAGVLPGGVDEQAAGTERGEAGVEADEVQVEAAVDGVRGVGQGVQDAQGFVVEREMKEP